MLIWSAALASSTIRQSYKHPTLCTVTVDGYQAQLPSESSSPTPKYYWKLPTADRHSDHNAPTRLHTVDIYFWTSQDADSFIDALRRLLNRDQLILLDFPPTPAANDPVVSPVVQRLEKAAIHDSHGQQASQGLALGSDSASHSQVSSVNAVESGHTEPRSDPASFKPLAYNPAAPAAPEPISHREKTPPPVDGEAGTGLVQAASADHVQATARPTYGLPGSSSGYVGGPPVQSHVGAYPGSPPSAVSQRTPTMPLPPPPPQSAQSPPLSFAPPPAQSPQSTTSTSQQLVRTETASSSQYNPGDSGAPTPASEILGSSYVGGHHQPLQHLQPHYPDYLASGHQASEPVGGYSNFQYTPHPQQQGQQAQENQYSVHNELYRPTEEEFAKMKPKKRQTYEAGPGQQPGKLEQGAARVDKGVNKFFKKLEKRIG